jgi:hypothetical protein
MIEDKRLGLTLIVQSGVIIPLAAIDPCSAEPGPGKGRNGVVPAERYT